MSDKDGDGIPDWADANPNQKATNSSQKLNQDMRKWGPKKSQQPKKPQQPKCKECHLYTPVRGGYCSACLKKIGRILV